MSILYDYLARLGRLGDTELAHVNPEEKALLKSRGGAGTVNPNTGLKEYYHQGEHYDAYKYANLYDTPFWSGHINEDSTVSAPSDAQPGEEYWDYIARREGEKAEEYMETEEYQESGGEGYDEWQESEASKKFTGWRDYGELDLTGKTFIDLSEEEREKMAQDITKGELEKGGMDERDYGAYMPKYDMEKEREMEVEGAKGIGQIGESAQTSLLNLYQKQQKGRGFAMTGNPMIDRQRENIFKDIQTKQSARYQDMVTSRTGMWEDYMEDWETGISDYITGVERGSI